MFKKISIIFVAAIFALSLNGCATTAKQKDLEAQGLRNQVSVLEAQLETKDQEIVTLKDSLAKVGEEEANKGIIGAPGKKTISRIKCRPKTKDIQTALRNAGYDPGPIDGRMGRNTKEAIRVFQKSNNLSVDGRVGKKTWALLQEYLYKKVK